MGWLVKAVRAHPEFAPSATIYVAVTACAIAYSRFSRVSWGHDRGRAFRAADVSGNAG
jgi:hypothetical protein